MNEWFDTQTTNKYENGWFGTKEECIEKIKNQALYIIIKGLQRTYGVIDWEKLTIEDRIEIVQTVLKGVLGYGLKITDTIEHTIKRLAEIENSDML